MHASHPGIEMPHGDEHTRQQVLKACGHFIADSIADSSMILPDGAMSGVVVTNIRVCNATCICLEPLAMISLLHHAVRSTGHALLFSICSPLIGV